MVKNARCFVENEASVFLSRLFSFKNCQNQDVSFCALLDQLLESNLNLDRVS